MSQVDTQTLKSRRQQQGFTQKQLAEAAGVSYSTLTKLEQGAIEAPSITLLNDVAAALACQTDELLQADSLDLAPNPKIGFVYFDVGGVLVRNLDPCLDMFAERIRKPGHAVKAVFYEFMDAGCRGNISLEELKLLIMLRLDVRLEPGARQQLLERSWIDDMEIIKPGHHLLTAVAKHHKIGLLTNVFKDFYPGFFQQGIVPEAPYKAVVKSSDIGLLKPEPAIYDMATQASKTAPERILLIDDTRVNIRAAREFGWCAEQFDECNPQTSVNRIIKEYFSG